MKQVFKLLGIYSICILAGCQSFKDKNINTIDLEGAIGKKISVDPYKTLCDSINFIPLQATDESLLPNRAYILFADQDNIFVSSSDCIYRFNSDGIFLNKIGRKGKGPKEYVVKYGVSVDSANKRLFFCIENNKIQIWGFDGEFQNEIKLNNTDCLYTNVSLVSEGKLVVENRSFSREGLSIGLDFFNLNGQLVKQIPLTTNNIKEQNIDESSLMYIHDNKLSLKSNYDEWIYRIDIDTILSYIQISLGKYNPTPSFIGDISHRDVANNSMAMIVSLEESDSYLYFLIVFERQLHTMIASKETHQVIYSDKVDTPYIGVNLMADIKFWPSFIDDQNVIYCLVPSENISDSNIEKIHKHSKQKNDTEIFTNPIVLKVYEKKSQSSLM